MSRREAIKAQTRRTQSQYYRQGYLDGLLSARTWKPSAIKGETIFDSQHKAMLLRRARKAPVPTRIFKGLLRRRTK